MAAAAWTCSSSAAELAWTAWNLWYQSTIRLDMVSD
jgi:hypothetical protein